MSKAIARVLLAMAVTLPLLVAGCGDGNGRRSGGGKQVPASDNDVGIEYPPGFALVEVPEPLSGDNPVYPEPDMSLPETGVAFEDGCFFTLLTRVTDADGINGRHQYSRFDPFNADGSMVLLVRDDGDYAVYRTGSSPYNDAGNLVAVTSGIAESGWTRRAAR